MDIKFIPAVTVTKISENRKQINNHKKLNLRLKAKIIHARKVRKNNSTETILTLIIDKDINNLQSLINREVILFIE